jgi:aminodeoxyfutalosine deaminase
VSGGPQDAAAHAAPYPKIELHVHLEATVKPARLLEIAHRNDVRLPARTEAGLERFYRFRGFDHFVLVWIKTTRALVHGRDFRQVVVDYAGELAARGCVYAEALFSPSEPMARGTPWQEIFEGYCDGADEARETHGVDVRFTPDITRDFPVEIADHLVGWAVRFRERGVVGISLGGSENRYPPELFERPFAAAREGGLKAAPHAGELAGPASVRGALDVLHADRLRHGVRAVEDPALLAEIAGRGIVCDVTPISNVRTGVVRSLAEHPLPRMLAAGVGCSISSDDPALMDTDLDRDCAAALSLGHTPRGMFDQALAGAFCEAGTKDRLRELSRTYDWAAAGVGRGHTRAD